jgi:aquaporin Z
MFAALKEHWPEYLMEAAGLGVLMISVCVVDALLEYPVSPAHLAVRDPTVRTVLRGLARGLTALGLIYSPWGKQSGAHFNPAVTLTFLWLGKVAAWDACFYTTAQFLGGLAGVFLTAALLGRWVADPAVHYAVTVPGPAGQAVAFLAEFLISLGLMLAVLIVSNTRRAARFTGMFAGTLMALYFVVERPYSGTSMNPARTFASAVPADVWTGLWLYFAAPLAGMVLAGEAYLLTFGRVYCAKLHHDNEKRCIFHHGYNGHKREREEPLVSGSAAAAAFSTPGPAPCSMPPSTSLPRSSSSFEASPNASPRHAWSKSWALALGTCSTCAVACNTAPDRACSAAPCGTARPGPMRFSRTQQERPLARRPRRPAAAADSRSRQALRSGRCVLCRLVKLRCARRWSRPKRE